MSDPLPIIQLNSLRRFEDGVWASNDVQPHFDYSDGDIAEENLQSILVDATDLTSLSVELEKKHRDWASEYHLSPLRSNLLRSLELTNFKTALEIGSGCGALSTYLGEQGLTVDAIEGSHRRARIGQLRCRNLPNVSFISENIFQLSLPRSYYDIVLFVGVMEYAGRFSPFNETAEFAVTRLLRMARSSLKKDGVIVIAIENRLGLKYLYGAGEDHYGTAFEGIHGYPNYAGIKTWSQREWSSLLQETALEFEFLYPFPDYKLPSLILSKHYLDQNSDAWAHLASISFRDYHNLASFPDTLPFWETVQQAGCLGEFSNSFLIVAGDSKNQIEQVAAFDFLHTSGLARRPEYRTITRKARGTTTVEKISLYPWLPTANTAPISHHITIEPFQKGIPLSTIWIQRLQIDPREELLATLAREYFQYLQSRFEKVEHPGILLDTLPMNIMITPTGEWISFDHEWSSSFPIDTSFVFFRGLFYFIHQATTVLQTVYREEPDCTLQTALERCAIAVGLNFQSKLEQFIDREEHIQETVLESRKGITTRDFLNLRMFSSRQPVQLFWATQGDGFIEERSQTKFISIGDYLQSLAFTLPEECRPPLQLRIDPGAESGLFDLPSIQTDWLRKPKAVTLQELRPIEHYDDQAIIYHNIAPYCSDHFRLFRSLNRDPNIVWRLPAYPECNDEGRLRITVLLKWLDWEPTEHLLKTTSQQLGRQDAQNRASKNFSEPRFLSRIFRHWPISRGR